METKSLRRERTDMVASNEIGKSITVTIKWKGKHSTYGKFVSKTKKYRTHGENSEYNTGGTVKIMKTRPLSKAKRWRLIQIIERAK